MATTDKAGEGAGAGGTDELEMRPDWDVLSRIPLKLSAQISLRGFRVKNLLGLKPEVLVRSEWSSVEDVTLKVGEVQMAWCEFEVVEQRMAVRLTRLA